MFLIFKSSACSGGIATFLTCLRKVAKRMTPSASSIENLILRKE